MRYLFESWDDYEYALLFYFLLGFFILLGSLVLRITSSNKTMYLRHDKGLLMTFVLLIIFFAGTRAIHVGVDTANYYNYFFLPGKNIDGVFNFFDQIKTEFLFEVLLFMTRRFDYVIFTLLIAIILNVALYKFVRKYTNYGIEASSLILFLTMASSISFLSLEINIIRNGLAIPFILFGLIYFSEVRYKKAIIFLIIAYFFHRTSIIPIFLVILIAVFNKIHIKYYLFSYVLTIIATFFGFGLNELSFLQDTGNEDIQRLVYAGETLYNIGFRPDFVLYNSFFLFLFMKFGNLKDKKNIFLTKYFILTSMVFYLNFNIPFSDRIGLYSWVVIPLLLFSGVNNKFPIKRVFVSSLASLFLFTINFYLFIKSTGKL